MWWWLVFLVSVGLMWSCRCWFCSLGLWLVLWVERLVLCWWWWLLSLCWGWLMWWKLWILGFIGWFCVIWCCCGCFDWLFFGWFGFCVGWSIGEMWYVYVLVCVLLDGGIWWLWLLFVELWEWCGYCVILCCVICGNLCV